MSIIISKSIKVIKKLFSFWNIRLLNKLSFHPRKYNKIFKIRYINLIRFAFSKLSIDNSIN